MKYRGGGGGVGDQSLPSASGWIIFVSVSMSGRDNGGGEGTMFMGT